ncbi:MAG: hemolysin III family protein [Rhodobacteraceae bacterium]|nr:hemolysin III family protein [Paracoccaceae bacterium]
MKNSQHEAPVLTRSEWLADGAIHIMGVFGAFFGAILLAVWTVEEFSTGQTIAYWVYGLTLIATFSASAVYNMSPWERLRPTLRRIDHAAIYLKIAGTYTPLVIMVGSLSAYFILALVWALAIFGVIRKLFFWQIPGRFGTVLYLVMGWLSVFIIWGLVPVVPAEAIWLIALGGLIYTLGVGFYLWKSLRFSKAIWHGFVVVASVCFYIAIVLGLRASLL